MGEEKKGPGRVSRQRNRYFVVNGGGGGKYEVFRLYLTEQLLRIGSVVLDTARQFMWSLELDVLSGRQWTHLLESAVSPSTPIRE